MDSNILTPLTLWEDFDDSLPLEESVIKELKHDGITFSDLYFSGRMLENGERVRIFAHLAKVNDGQDRPFLLIIPDSEKPIDLESQARFVKNGYSVLTFDYDGQTADKFSYTKYPSTIDYANTDRAGSRIDFADQSAKQTSWYEWVAVAKYAVKYLEKVQGAKKIGALGIRRGGDIMWQLIAGNLQISCAVTLFGCGWSAYRGIYKYDTQAEHNEDAEIDNARHKFVAAVDAHAYAPYAKCPVLLLTSTNDNVYDADRAFDTLMRINEKIESFGNFTVGESGNLSTDCINDLDLFFEKYLKGASYDFPQELEVSIDLEKGEHTAYLKINTLENLEGYELYYSDGTVVPMLRDWIRAEEYDAKCNIGNKKKFALEIYNGSSTVFAFAKAHYKNGFTISSAIAAFKVDNTAKNLYPKSKVICSSRGQLCGFTVAAPSDYFNSNTSVTITEGAFGIKGVSSKYGLKSYRVGSSRYRAEQDWSIKLDLYSKTFNTVKVIVYAEFPVYKKYSCEVSLHGGEIWQGVILDASDFKSVTGQPLKSFSEALIIEFHGRADFVVNNIIWL